MRVLRTLTALILTASLLLSLLVLPAAVAETPEPAAETGAEVTGSAGTAPDPAQTPEAADALTAPGAAPADPVPGGEPMAESLTAAALQTGTAGEEDEAPAEEPPEEEPPAEEPPAEEPPAGPALTAGHTVYVQGFPDGTFRPGDSLTRAQAVQMVARLLADPGGGDRPCSFTDVPEGRWFTQAVRDVTAWGLIDDGVLFRPGDLMSRADFTALLVRLHPEARGEARFSDVAPSHPAYDAIGAAAALGWVTGYPDGTFHPYRGLTRAEAVAMLNRAANRPGDSAQARRLLAMGLFPDIGPRYWAGTDVVEAAVAHTPVGAETWTGLDYGAMTFTAGFHPWEGNLYYADRNGKLAVNCRLGAYAAGADGALTLTASSYVLPNVTYLSQIDNIYAWVGCEAVAALPGLWRKGFAQGVTLKRFLDNLPRSSSDPEKGFVGSPYVPDKTKRTRTTIYPAKLAQYCNSYCGGQKPCADFRGASVEELQRELLAGNMVVGYLTLWWAAPKYRNYNIEGQIQSLVSNNHAILICGYDPNRGYFVSDPYNYYNRGQVYQYWENKATFERIWNERKVGMVIR